MMRSRRVLLRIGAKYLVRELLLLLGHRIIEIVEGWDQLL
jgi:hypothetical protein